jgi:hypothetical protein
MKQVPYLGPTNIRAHRIKFGRLGDLARDLFDPALCFNLNACNCFVCLPTCLPARPSVRSSFYLCILPVHVRVLKKRLKIRRNMCTCEGVTRG